ncbi:MAG: alpha-L-fucosidase, partial [Clostridiales bacterium]|nr:alpha-L-fucosidase [Clostridiales bacterium]
KSMRLLADGSDIPVRVWKGTAQYGDFLYVNFGERATATYPLPDDRDTVVEIILKDSLTG